MITATTKDRFELSACDCQKHFTDASRAGFKPDLIAAIIPEARRLSCRLDGSGEELCLFFARHLGRNYRITAHPTGSRTASIRRIEIEETSEQLQGEFGAFTISATIDWSPQVGTIAASGANGAVLNAGSIRNRNGIYIVETGDPNNPIPLYVGQTTASFHRRWQDRLGLVRELKLLNKFPLGDYRIRFGVISNAIPPGTTRDVFFRQVEWTMIRHLTINRRAALTNIMQTSQLRAVGGPIAITNTGTFPGYVGSAIAIAQGGRLELAY